MYCQTLQVLPWSVDFSKLHTAGARFDPSNSIDNFAMWMILYTENPKIGQKFNQKQTKSMECEKSHSTHDFMFTCAQTAMMLLTEFVSEYRV